MIYKIEMLCKHFKGETLKEKNIYKIIKLNVDGKDIDENQITYTGDNVLKDAKNLVIYENIFQDGKLFAREYSDISSKLSDEKQKQYNQNLKVEPLTDEEISIVNDKKFIEEKIKYTNNKFSNVRKRD